MKWITQYEKGEFEVELNTDELNERLDIFNLAAQRLADRHRAAGHGDRLGVCHEHAG